MTAVRSAPDSGFRVRTDGRRPDHDLVTGRPRYGVDGWPYVAGLWTLAGGSALAAVLLRRRRPVTSVALGAAGTAAAVPAALGTAYVLGGKQRLRDRLLDQVDWTGDEAVVDLGAGAGLLAIGAARRTSGRVHAVDVFSGRDLSGNSPSRLWRNARIEGVEQRVVLHRSDVRELDLPDASIDVIVSTLCLHNLGDGADRCRALDEAVRVLRPGGTIVVSDLAHVAEEYAPHLQAAGLTVLVARARGTFPPQRFLVARSSPVLPG